MAWYTEEQIERVRTATDIVELIGSHVRLKRTGGSYVGLCPFHSEKSPSFNVNPARQMYKCFGCGVGGNVYTFVMEYENYTFPEAVEYLAEKAGITLPKAERSREQRQEDNLRIKLLEINLKAAKYFYAKLKSPQGELGYEYLSSRGLTDETILHFGLGYAGQGGAELYQYLQREGYEDRILRETGLFKMDERGVYDKFWNRVIFPIMDVNNRVIGFGGRVMGDAKPKYLNSPETKLFDKSRNLFGLNYARQGKRDFIILCEGYMDVIALHQAGFQGAVASLGTAFTAGQAMLLKRYTKKVLLTYDSDSAGVKAALRAIPILREAGISAKIVNMEPCKDPDEFIKSLGAEEFEKRLEGAENSFFFEVETLRKGYDMEDPEQKTAFYHEMAKKLLVFEEKIQRDNYIEALAAKYSIRGEDLHSLVVKYGSQMPPPEYRVAERENRDERRAAQREPEIYYSYRLLLSWLTAEPDLFPAVSKIVQPEDYSGELYRGVAELLYGQLREGNVIPAKIMNHFQDMEEQKTVASMFQTDFNIEMGHEEKEKAINELVYTVKQYSLDKQIRELTDLGELQRLISEKKALQSPEKLHISL